MANLLQTDSFDRAVGVEELRARVSELNLTEALGVITKLSSRHPWMEETPENLRRVNLINLSLLAKAIVLWADPNGRPLRLTGGADDDLSWLFTAINSMQWYSRPEMEADRSGTIISMLMRQAYVRTATADHLDWSIARTFGMFHEIIRRGTFPVPDINSAMEQATGLTSEDLWVLCAAIYFFYFLESVHEDEPRVISPDFFLHSPIKDELATTLRRTFSRIARTPQELRDIYAAEEKYRHAGLPDEYWVSEFNILRDYPIVKIGEDRYCCPFPVFAFTRGSVGFYFDLLNHFAEIERRDNPSNSNPFDNAMSQTLGGVFQEYVATHLRTLTDADKHLSAEFPYTVKKQELLTPDWILSRPGRALVLFECKARRPTLPLQRRASRADIEAEIRGVLSRALKQAVVFLGHADAGNADLAAFKGLPKVIYSLVLYEPFHYHAVPDIRQLIDDTAATLHADWPSYRDRILFVPLGIRELETAVALERERNVPLEQQLEEYATYRCSAPRLRVSAEGMEVAKHFEEYALDRWNGSRRCPSAVCQGLWERFLDFVFRRLYRESLSDYEQAMKRRWIQEAAYFMWVNEGRVHGRHLQHWLAAEQEYENLERRLGMPPYEAERMKRYEEFQRRLG
jgi:hypothetical protein